MNRFLFSIAVIAGVSSAATATPFDLEGVAPGTYGALNVSDGPLSLTITTVASGLVNAGNLSNPPLLGLVGVAGFANTGEFSPLRWSFNNTLDAITFNFGDLGGDDDSPVLIQAYGTSNNLLGSATTDYVSGFSAGKSLSLSFSGMSYFITSSGSADANFNSLVWDIGSVTQSADGAVPEPASWALMIAGFGMTGAALRRRKVAVSFA